MGLFAWETRRSENGEIKRTSEIRQALDLDSLSRRDLAPETSHCRSPMARQSPEGDEAKVVSSAPSTPYGLGPLRSLYRVLLRPLPNLSSPLHCAPPFAGNQ